MNWVKELLNNAIELPESKKRELIRKAQEGDKRSKELLILSDIKLIYRVACETCRYIENFEHLEDVVQFLIEVYLKTIPSYSGKKGTKFTTFVYRALVWGKKEYIRRHRSLFNTEKNHMEAIDRKTCSVEEVEIPAVWEDELINRISFEQMKEKIYGELHSIDPKLALIVLRRLEGKTLKEIGLELGCTKQRVNQVLKENKTILFRVCSKYL